MFVYIFVFLIVFLFFLIEQNVNNKRYKKSLFLIGSIAVTFILAFRGDNVGGDTIAYCRFFDGKGSGYGTVNNPDPDIDLGFVWFSRFLRLFGQSRFLFLFITSLITLLPWLYLIWRDCKYKLLPLCIYMTGFNLLILSQTSIRQNISVSLILIAYILLTSNSLRKRWKLLFVPIVVLYSLLCHKTSVITIPLVLIAYLIPISKKTSIIVLTASLLIGYIISDIANLLLEQFYFIFSSNEFADHLTGYYGQTQYESQAGLILLVDYFIVVSILLMSPAMSFKQNIKNLPIKCLVWGSVLTFLGNGFVLICRIVLLPIVLGFITSPVYLTKKKYFLLRMALISCILVYEVYMIRFLCDPNASVETNHMLPYKFIFE